MNKDVVAQLVSMRHSPIHNYIVPGLTSWMIVDSEVSKVRMFEMNRHQHMSITPHSHRFGFSCFVIEGFVENTLYSCLDKYAEKNGDEYALIKQTYEGTQGLYKLEYIRKGSYTQSTTTFREGDWYTMTANEIHSIKFRKGAKVLFFEGKSERDFSMALEPIAHGHHIKTLETKEWMFVK